MIRSLFSNKVLNICYIIIFLGLSCLLAFYLIGSEVDENNILREPFGLIPLGFLLIVTGALGICFKVCATIFLHFLRRKK